MLGGELGTPNVASVFIEDDDGKCSIEIEIDLSLVQTVFYMI